MAVKFTIKNIFTLSSHNCVVIGGIIGKGTIRKGMLIHVGDKKIPIDAIEIINTNNTGMAGLVMKYKSDKEKKSLEQIFKNKKEVQIYAS